jgi:hypothetical protein
MIWCEKNDCIHNSTLDIGLGYCIVRDISLDENGTCTSCEEDESN